MKTTSSYGELVAQRSNRDRFGGPYSLFRVDIVKSKKGRLPSAGLSETTHTTTLALRIIMRTLNINQPQTRCYYRVISIKYAPGRAAFGKDLVEQRRFPEKEQQVLESIMLNF